MDEHAREKDIFYILHIKIYVIKFVHILWDILSSCIKQIVELMKCNSIVLFKPLFNFLKFILS